MCSFVLLLVINILKTLHFSFYVINGKIYRIRKVLESKSNTEDDKVAVLEAQLAQAKQIAEEADRKYEEVE